MPRGVLERFRKGFGDDSVAGFERKHVVAIINERAQSGRHAANTLRKVLRHLFDHAVEINLRTDNPVIGTKRLKTAGDGHHTWTAEEVAQYRAHWKLGTVPRLVMELAFELAARRAEIVSRGPQHERPATPKAPYGKLFVERLKGSNDTLVPISAELRAAIDACAPFEHLTYLATKRGVARSYKSLTGDFRKWCDDAKLPKCCRLHGLKKSALTALAQDRASIKEMQSISGHRSLAVLQKYIEKTNQDQLAEEVMARRGKGRAG
jgi:integrase